MNIRSIAESRAARPFPRWERPESLKLTLKRGRVNIGGTRGERDAKSRISRGELGRHFELTLKV
jgi:hypothetical protein